MSIKLKSHRQVILSAIAASMWFSFSALEAAHAQLAPRDRGYVGTSYLEWAGVVGDWQAAPYRNWARIDAHYWWNSRNAAPGASNTQRAAAAPVAGAPRSSSSAAQPQANAGGNQRPATASTLRTTATASAPGAPRSGAGTLVVALDKDNAALPSLMEACRNGAVAPQATYAVSTERSRGNGELGALPEGMPENFEYRLRDARIIDCPIAEGAPQQALVIAFADIEWLNWRQDANSVPVNLEPAALQPLPTNLSGQSKAWVLTWFAPANDVASNQCPVMNARPAVEEFYALLPPAEAEAERAALAGQGGPNYENGQMGLRGPGRLNVTFLPGIVADPGHAEPRADIARGLNLDGDTRAGRGQREYVSEDRRIVGIDNQLYTVQGCVQGWQGHNGFIYQFFNNQMRDGQMSMIVEIHGIDNERNDDEVFVDWLYSLDPMAKNGAGTQILPNFTFHVTDNVELTHYFQRVRARIVNGVVTTDPLQYFALNLGFYGPPPELELRGARMRFELQPDGNIKGVLAGYQDWRRIASTYVSSTSEFYHGFQQPGYYNSLRRNADGIRNPITGEFDGISSAYDVEGVPALVVRSPNAVAQGSGGTGGGG